MNKKTFAFVSAMSLTCAPAWLLAAQNGSDMQAGSGGQAGSAAVAPAPGTGSSIGGGSQAQTGSGTESSDQAQMESGNGTGASDDTGAQAGTTDLGAQSGGPATSNEAAMEGGSQQLMSKKISDINGMSVVNAQGKELGEVNKVVRNKQDQRLAAVISVGGFLGIGEKKVAIPFNELQLQGGNLVASIGANEDQLKQQQKYDKSQYQEVQAEQTVAAAMSGGAAGATAQSEPGTAAGGAGVGAGGAATGTGAATAQSEGGAGAAGASQQTAFADMDKNGDGYISKDEAQSNAQLNDQWAQADTNADDRLSRAEFSAFEQGSAGGGGATMGGPQVQQGGSSSGGQSGGGAASDTQMGGQTPSGPGAPQQ